MIVSQTPVFSRQKKKLHPNQIQSLDEAIRTVLDSPMVGEQKKGDLSFVRIFKFKMV